MIKRRTLLIIPVIIAVTLQTACTTSQSTTALGVAQIAVNTVIAELQIQGKIPAADIPAITAWANDASTAFTLSAMELATADTSAVKTLKIAGYWAATLKDYAAISPSALPYVQLAQNDITAFLNIVTPATVSPADRKMLKQIGATSMANKRSLAAIRASN
jgi:hypothetical protein